MNINASIVDQRVNGIVEQFSNELGAIVGQEATRQKSLAFILLGVSTVLDCPPDEALDLLTEGGGTVITSAVTAEAVMAVWRKCPQLSATFRRGDLLEFLPVKTD